MYRARDGRILVVDDRTRIASGSPFEPTIGFSRAVRVGDLVVVSGTGPVFPQGDACPDDAGRQARRCFELIRAALEGAGASMEHVVRTRMFVTDISRWEEYGRAHGEIFGGNPPATSMVEVRRLIDPAMLIEIEADAVIER